MSFIHALPVVYRTIYSCDLQCHVSLLKVYDSDTVQGTRHVGDALPYNIVYVNTESHCGAIIIHTRLPTM